MGDFSCICGVWMWFVTFVLAALGALRNMAFGDANLREVRRVDPVSLIRDAMRRHPSNSALQDEGRAALSNLGANSNG